jgi:tetratricopeptide repeat protein
VNKEHFNKLVANYSKLDGQVDDLEKLVKEFPYSQPVRMLNVKSYTGVSKKKFQQRLALAAFYATDRNVLRSLIENGKVPSDLEDKIVPPVKKSKKVVKKDAPPPPVELKKQTIDAKKLREEVLANLEILQQTKSSFLQLTELSAKPVKKMRGGSSKTPTVTKKPAVKRKKASPEVKKSKKIVAKSTTKGKNTLTPQKANKKQLIDKFIADEPSITPGKAVKENQSDLSKASSELKEDLVSENLAVIFAKQGKTNKAIEIYKKLIWKFPQKKASFAARIEELKKK